MNINKEFLKKAGIVALFFLGFWIISMWYLRPALDNKVLRQGDMQQVTLMRYTADTLIKNHGITPNWNDRVFSGMPSSLISGIPQGSLLIKYRVLEFFGLVKSPFNFLFLAMMSMFVLLLSVKVDKWLAAAGALGYAFMTFSISSFEAGHVTKVLSMAVMPGTLAGLILITNRSYLWGASIIALFFGMLINYFHYQVAYYMGLVILLYFIIQLIYTIKNGEWKHYIIGGVAAGLAMGLGTVTCISKIEDTVQYSNATMRGGSAVASDTPKGGPKQNANAKGLDIDYAFSWSYGIDESLTLIVPRYKGGSSDEPVPENEYGVDRLPTYFGDLQFTSGPIYMGAILMFFFIFSIVFSFQWKKLDPENQKAIQLKQIMWFSLVTFLVSLFLSWGRNLALNEFLFNHLPYYNKFRTPMMTLVIAQMIVPFFGLYGFYLFMMETFKEEWGKKFLKSAIIVAVALIGIVMLGTMSSDFKGASDKEIAKSSGQEAVSVIKDMRSKLVWNDIWRALMFIALSVAMVYAAIKKQLKPLYISVILLVFISFDMISVSGRYLNDENWQEKEEEAQILPSQVDEQVVADNKDGARVFDMRINPFNDNHAAPFHKNVGGYHPAKLSRYQDIISYCITPDGGQMNGDIINHNNALDMLNCRYVLTMAEDKKREEVFMRNSALGHAWFVNTVKMAPTAKDALDEINKVDIRNTAVCEDKETLKPTSLSFQTDSTCKITQTNYSTDSISYTSHSNNSGLAVFSEVYYNEKNGGWKVFIDGKEAKALRLNYILRGVELPQGDHKITWIYVPTLGKYYNLEMGTSALILLLFFGMLFKQMFSKNEIDA